MSSTKCKFTIPFSLSIVLMSASAWAQLQLSETVQLSGFGSVSAAKSDHQTPVLLHRNISDDWCFDCDTIFGLQMDWQISSNWRSALQVVKRPQDDFSSPQLEQAYLEYTYQDIKLKVGRLRVPLYIMSEYYYVSAAYPWIRLPPEVYSNNLGVTNYDGASVSWNTMINDVVQFTFSPYVRIPEKEKYQLYGADFTLDSDFAYGFSSELYFDGNLLHFAYSKIKTKQKDLLLPETNYNLNFFSIGVSYQLSDNLRFLSEALLEDDFTSNWYASFDYRIGDITPYIQYGQGRKTKDRQSYLVGLRYDITPQINASFEWQRFEGDEELISGEFTELQDSTTPLDSKVDLLSVGISFVF